MISGSVVKVPCPISAAGDTMVMVPSVAMVSQTFGASGVSRAAASPMKSIGSAASVSAKVRPAAVPSRKSRRLMVRVSWLSPPAPRAGSR